MTLKGRHFISTQDYTLDELKSLLARAIELKRSTHLPQPLAGKAVALAFFNPSLRTRMSMELGVQKLGGIPITLNVGTDSWTLEHRDDVVMNENKTEHVKDAVRVMSRFVHAIGVRSFPKLENLDEDVADAVIMAFKRHSPVPVINLESALGHPCQAMADMLTIQERRSGHRGTKVVLTWAPHPKPLPTAVPNSFLLAATQFGCDVTLAHPPEITLPPRVLDLARQNARTSGGSLRILHDQQEALSGAHVVYAKSWGGITYYGRWEKELEVRRSYANWIVNERTLSNTADAFFMHCLPVRRNVEVADDVLDSSRSAAIDEAENRLWVQMAILEAIVR